MMNNLPEFRPPAEADSLILQIACGCPHNTCSFCGMYKGRSYRQRPLDEALALIRQETRRSAGATRVFLADGDVMHLPHEELRAILVELAARLPHLSRVNLYANGSSILAKSEAELRALRALKLHTLYLGLESGDARTLQAMHKQETVEAMIEAGQRAQACGLKLSVMVLLGLAGQERSQAHAAATAAALNRMQPRLLSVLRIIPAPGTGLDHDVRAGHFKPLTEYEAVQELKALVSLLELEHTIFRANHSSNIVPLEARFPRDKQILLAQLDALLDSGNLDAETPGPQPLWL